MKCETHGCHGPNIWNVRHATASARRDIERSYCNWVHNTELKLSTEVLGRISHHPSPYLSSLSSHTEQDSLLRLGQHVNKRNKRPLSADMASKFFYCFIKSSWMSEQCRSFSDTVRGQLMKIYLLNYLYFRKKQILSLTCYQNISTCIYYVCISWIINTTINKYYYIDPTFRT